MSTTVLYFLPTTSADTSPLPRVIQRLTTVYNPSLLTNWTLKQRLFRSTPAPSAESTFDSRYLQIVSLPDHPQDSYAVITPTEPPMANGSPTAAIVSISVGASTEDFSQLLLTKLAPLWQPRHLLAVVDGLCYQVGDFRIRVGEVKQGIGSSQLVRGVAIELAFMNPDEGGLESCDGATQMIMTFWEELSLTGAKEFFSDREDDGFQDVRLWCRMLTLRN